MRKVGVFGGSFHPVHNGHLQMAKEAQQLLNLDEILWIPAAQQPFKQNQEVLPYETRRRWLELALKGEPTWNICDMEQERGGISYTFDTMRTLLEQNPDTEFYFLTGADSLEELHLWHRWKELLDICYFVVTTRPGYALELPEQIREGNSTAKKGIKILPIVALPISSTDVRNRIRNGESVQGLIPDILLEEVKDAWK